MHHFHETLTLLIDSRTVNKFNKCFDNFRFLRFSHLMNSIFSRHFVSISMLPSSSASLILAGDLDSSLGILDHSNFHIFNEKFNLEKTQTKANLEISLSKSWKSDVHNLSLTFSGQPSLKCLPPSRWEFGPCLRREPMASDGRTFDLAI